LSDWDRWYEEIRSVAAPQESYGYGCSLRDRYRFIQQGCGDPDAQTTRHNADGGHRRGIPCQRSRGNPSSDCPGLKDCVSRSATMPLFQSISFVLALMLTAGIAAGEPQSRSTTQPAARGSVPVRQDFWESTHPPSAGEERWMAYTMLLAKTFGFSSYQKTRVLQFAQQ